MTMFASLNTAASGARLAETWMTAISNNVANSQTVRPAGQEPFRAQRVVATPVGGFQGVRISDIVEVDDEPDLVYEPGNPLADADGYVTRPVVDLTDELTSLLIAQRLYQANLNVHQQARDAYRSALTIGRS